MSDLKDDLTGLNAIAWSLYTEKVGPTRVYRILLVDCYVAVGSGPDADRMTYKVHKRDTAAEAQDFAISETARIERRGFAVYHQPMQRRVQGGKRSWLDGLVGKRTRNGGLTSSVNLLLIHGEPVEPV